MIDALIKRVSVTYKCYEMYAHLGKKVQENRKRTRERDTDTDSLEDRIDSIEKSAKIERVKDCDKMKEAKGKVNL
jgi:hypothetical protein